MNDGLYGNSTKLNSGLIGVLLYQRIEYFMHIQKVMHYQFLNYFVGVLQCCATLMLQIHGNSTKSIKLYKTRPISIDTNQTKIAYTQQLKWPIKRYKTSSISIKLVRFL